MTIAWDASYLEVIIYLLCVATSLLCAYLLARAYRRGRTKLLIWSALCFALLAINNLVLAADVLLLPTIDLTVVRLLTSLAGGRRAAVRLHLGSPMNDPSVNMFLAGMVTAGFLACGLFFARFWVRSRDSCSWPSPRRSGCWR